MSLLSRRQFALSAAAAASQPVVVIGAGLAGLAAAREMQRAGFDVRILEARARSGGRVYTVRPWRKFALDLGASWIHGVNGNPLAELARAARARTLRTLYGSSQSYVSADLRAAGLNTPHADRWQEKVAVALQAQGSPDISVAEAVRRRVGTPAGEIDQAELSFYLNDAYATEWGATATELSALHARSDESFGGGDVILPDGFDQLIRHLAQGLRIDHGVRVNKIAYSGDTARLTTSAGNLTASAVILTVPLGVLQAGAIDFEPSLPPAHQEAIARLGMGTLSKTYLLFDRTFWPATDWLEYVSGPPARWSQWVNLAQTGAAVLMGLNAGDEARRIERAAPREVRAEAMAALRDMFGRAIPEPAAIETTNWSTDPLARGSYSFHAVGSTPDHRRALAATVERCLFFAGEATEADYFGTAHGAYLSGVRAAREVEAAIRARRRASRLPTSA
ncbi:MAG: FAD-dependent oxidoreductase [Bryobacterales bacterium]|nr:FAD-dependent oxidoreductase [Bryobacterales bacterium]